MLSHDWWPLWPGWILATLKLSVGILEPKNDFHPIFWTLTVHRHQNHYFMNCTFGHAGCWKTMAKKDILYANIDQSCKILDIWELYTSKESLECLLCKFKKKKYDFLRKKIVFGNFCIFFKGGTLCCQNCQKRNIFFKNFIKKFKKWLLMRPFKHKQKQSHEFWWF